MKKKTLMHKGLISTLGAFCIAAPEAEAKKAKPNIIFILADDLGYGDVGYQGCTEIPTPNIDYIAHNGIAFSAGYSAAPVCGPSRAGLMTGKYQNRYGYSDNLGPYVATPDTEPGISLKEKMIPQYLNKLGYKTAMIGKWHDSEDMAYWPHNRGFQYTLVFNNGAAENWNNAKAPHARLHENGQTIEGRTEYFTDVFGDASVKFINKNKNTPFFLYTAFNAVHGPLQAPDSYMERVGHLKGNRQKMAAMHIAMDDQIGRILKALKQNKLERKTLIFFASDNGGKPKGNFSFNGELSGEKGTMWEGGIRVPFCAMWQGTIPAGSKTDTPVHFIDILPTVVKAAGGTVQSNWGVEGIDIMPLMTQKQSLKNRDVFWQLNTNWAMRDNKWKISSINNKIRLYKIDSDISEKQELSRKFPEVVQELKKKMEKWQADNAPTHCGWNKTVCKHWKGTFQWPDQDQFENKGKKKKRH